MRKITAAQEGIALVEADLAAGKITEAQAAEKFREYRDQMIEGSADLISIRQDV
jgi:hypothetical protein